MTTVVVLLLWRRDFASRSLAILRGDWDDVIALVGLTRQQLWRDKEVNTPCKAFY